MEPAKIRAFIDSISGALRSSMQKDVAAKRPLELDGIAGPIVRGGKRYGIEVPVTRELMAAVQAKAA